MATNLPNGNHKAGIETTRRKISALRRYGHYQEGHHFISNLSVEDRQVVAIAIEAAQLYLVQGHYIRAAEASAFIPSLFPAPEEGKDEIPGAAFAEDRVCLELIRAFIDIPRHCKLNTAVSIAERVHAIWLSPKGRAGFANMFNSVPEEERKLCVARISEYQLLLSGNESESAKRPNVSVPETRILIEFYYHKIMVVAAEQGLLNEKSVKSAAEARLEVLQSYALCHGRLREARYLTYFWISLLGRDIRVRSILETFLQLLNEEHLEVEKALSLKDLAENLINTGDPAMITEGRTHLDTVRSLFQNANHSFGFLDVSKLEYMSAEASVTATEDFEKTQALAQEYHNLGVYQSSIRELAFAIPRALRFGGLSTQIRDSLGTLTQWVEEVGGELLKQVVYMSSVSEALLHAPEYGPALQSIKSYITNPPSEIGPKNYGLLIQQLRRAYSGLGNVTEALVYAEKAFKIFSAGMSYIDKSDAAFDLALARWDCSQRYSNGSEDAQTWLESAAVLLQDWANNDARREHHDGEQQKCAQLAIIRYHQASIDDDKDMSLIATSWQDREKSCNPSRAISRRAASTVELQVRAEIDRKNFDEALTMALHDANTVESFPGPSTFENAQSCSRIATILHMKVLYCLERDAPHSEQVRQEMYSELLQAMGWAVKALNLYRSTIGAEVVVSCTNHLWLLIQDLRIFNESIAKDLS